MTIDVHLGNLIAALVAEHTKDLPAKHRERYAKLVNDFKTARAIELARLQAEAPPPRTQTSVSWAVRSELNKLYFFRYSDEPPLRVDYSEASTMLQIQGVRAAQTTLRQKISMSPSKSILFLVKGKYHVLSKGPDGLEPALRTRFEQTQNPEHIVKLSPKPDPNAPTKPPKNY